MGREIKNINKQAHSGCLSFRLFLFFLLITALFCLSGCTGFKPELLTYTGERDQIIEDVLRRGRIYSLRLEDEQALIDLLEDPDPEVRMTVLKIMEDNPSQTIYDAVLRATLDQDDDITDEAYRILLDNWEEARFAAIRGLNALSASIILSSINVINKKESAEDGRYLLTLFSDSRKIIRSSASRNYARTGSYEDPWFQDMLHHEDPVSKLTAVETLSRFGDPRLIPEIIPYIRDSNPEIGRAALFGLSEFDDKALPYLHNVLRFKSDDDLRIDVLQIVEGILDSSSIPVLISLMDDGNKRIALKSVEILLRYGADRVVPFLVDAMGSMDRTALTQSFLLATKFQDQRLLPLLAAYFTDDDSEISGASIDAVRSYGGLAADFLLDQLEIESASRSIFLKLLVELREPRLVYDSESAEYRTDNIFLLFELVSQDEIFEYLRYVSLPSRIVTALWSLYDIETNTALYQKCRRSARHNVYPYFYYFREWEQFMLNAEASRTASFTYLQYFFDTDEKKWLHESDMLRDTAELYGKGAERSYGRAVSSGRSASEEELALLADYQESRLSLISRWRSLTSDIQDLGRLIFLRYSLDIESLAEEYDFFRSVPKGDFPVPENF